MYLEILCVTLKRIQYISYFSLFKTIFIPSISEFVDAIKSGEYSRIFSGDYDSPDLELNETPPPPKPADDFFIDLTKQPDTNITIFISLIIPAIFALACLFNEKTSPHKNFFVRYFFTYLSISFATILVVLSLVLITLGSNKLAKFDSARTKDCILPLLCGFSYSFIPVDIALKIITLALILCWLLRMSTFFAVIIFIVVAIYFSMASAKISVMVMDAMPSMSKDKKHVWLVASSVFTLKFILITHIYVNLS